MSSIDETSLEYLERVLEKYGDIRSMTIENHKKGKFATHYDLYQDQIQAGAVVSYAAQKLVNELNKQKEKKRE